MGLYLASTTLNQAALAQGQARRAASRGGVRRRLLGLGPDPDGQRPGAADRGRLRAAAAVLCALLWRAYRDPAALRPARPPVRRSRRGCRWPTRRAKARRRTAASGYGRGGARPRADPGRRAAARGRTRRREGRRPGSGPRPAAVPRPRDAGRLGGHRRGRVGRRRRAHPHAGHDRPGPDPVRGRADRRLERDPAGARHRGLARQRRHGRDRADHGRRRDLALRPRDARGPDRRLGRGGHRQCRDLRRAARLAPAPAAGAGARGRVGYERSRRAAARDRVHRLDRGARLRRRRHGRRAGGQAGDRAVCGLASAGRRGGRFGTSTCRARGSTRSPRSRRRRSPTGSRRSCTARASSPSTSPRSDSAPARSRRSGPRSPSTRGCPGSRRSRSSPCSACWSFRAGSATSPSTACCSRRR